MPRLSTQGSYAGGPQIHVGGNYTLSRAYGNVDGETVNSGPSGALGQTITPNTGGRQWNYPEGDLAIDQRHRARGWANLHGADGIRPPDRSPSVCVQQFGSGVPYGAVGLSVPTAVTIPNPGYATPPAGRSNISSRRATRSGPKRHIEPMSP